MTAAEFVEAATNDNRANPWKREFVQDVVEFAMAHVREQAAKIAERMAIPGHAVQAPSCVEIAKEIRGLIV